MQPREAGQSDDDSDHDDHHHDHGHSHRTGAATRYWREPKPLAITIGVFLLIVLVQFLRSKGEAAGAARGARAALDASVAVESSWTLGTHSALGKSLQVFETASACSLKARFDESPSLRLALCGSLDCALGAVAAGLAVVVDTSALLHSEEKELVRAIVRDERVRVFARTRALAKRSFYHAIHVPAYTDPSLPGRVVLVGGDPAERRAWLSALEPSLPKDVPVRELESLSDSSLVGPESNILMLVWVVEDQGFLKERAAFKRLMKRGNVAKMIVSAAKELEGKDVTEMEHESEGGETYHMFQSPTALARAVEREGGFLAYTQRDTNAQRSNQQIVDRVWSKTAAALLGTTAMARTTTTFSQGMAQRFPEASLPVRQRSCVSTTGSLIPIASSEAEPSCGVAGTYRKDLSACLFNADACAFLTTHACRDASVFATCRTECLSVPEFKQDRTIEGTIQTTSRIASVTLFGLGLVLGLLFAKVNWVDPLLDAQERHEKELRRLRKQQALIVSSA